ncbi:hypothetical protein D3C87_1779940 [compost metagenome]
MAVGVDVVALGIAHFVREDMGGQADGFPAGMGRIADLTEDRRQEVSAGLRYASAEKFHCFMALGSGGQLKIEFSKYNVWKSLW